MIREAISQVTTGATLSENEAAIVMEEIMTGVATQAQMGAFLTALHLRPGNETVQEITGLARVMRQKAVRVHLNENIAIQAIDTCGTGGDRAGTFNVSTAAGIVAAAAGASVAKHGNRSATSHCGSADVGPTRREIGIPTVFNILGPLTNPAHTHYQVLGVADGSLLRTMGEALLQLGCKRALIIHGEDGIDECSLSAPTRICEVRKGEDLREYIITPEEVGFTRVTDRHAFQGATPAYNAKMLQDLLSGQNHSPAADMICLNVGAALLANELVSSFSEGAKLAHATLREGKAKRKLEDVITYTQMLVG